ncbi:uncharacterized protein LOC128231600 [Mya arenaria]|uniref:uncharacterized protein LOC128231600 n=1 Tax=Mya arenaria TaxID=6604 RepID=UPI0022E60CC8|nr:uncharacterized protein LOC128231600 [Mya arenaria]
MARLWIIACFAVFYMLSCSPSCVDGRRPTPANWMCDEDTVCVAHSTCQHTHWFDNSYCICDDGYLAKYGMCIRRGASIDNLESGAGSLQVGLWSVFTCIALGFMRGVKSCGRTGYRSGLGIFLICLVIAATCFTGTSAKVIYANHECLGDDTCIEHAVCADNLFCTCIEGYEAVFDLCLKKGAAGTSAGASLHSGMLSVFTCVALGLMVGAKLSRHAGYKFAD